MSLERRRLSSSIAKERSFSQVQREAKRAVVRMTDGVTIRGMIHIPPGTRPLDFLNHPTDTFIAITGATVSISGREEQAQFIAVNKAHILTLDELERHE